MSVQADASLLRGGHARIRALLGSEAAAVSVLLLLAAVLAAVAWGTWGDLDSDTGYDLEAGARVASGELPYRDFTYYYGPLSPALNGLFAFVLGPGVSAGVALGLLVTSAILGATYLLARVLVGRAGAFVATAITAGVAFIPDNYSYVLPHTASAPLGTLLLLILLLCAHRFLAMSRDAWLIGMGVAAGLLTLTKPEVTLAAFVSAGVWLALRARRGGRPLRESALFAVPALGTALIVYGFLATQVSLHRLVLENLYPKDFLDAAGNTLVKARMPLTVESFAEVVGRGAAYTVGAALLVLLAVGIERPRYRQPLLAALVGAGIVLIACSLAKPDGLRDAFYWIWGWIPVGAVVAVAVCVNRYRRARHSWTAMHQLELLASTALAVVAGTTYASFVFNGWRPQMAVYYAPFAAILIARVHLVELARRHAAFALGLAWVVFVAAAGIGLTLQSAHQETFTVRGPGGSLAETTVSGRVMQDAVNEIVARTTPSERILVGPLLTGLYTLSDRRSASSENALLPGSLVGGDRERQVIDELEQRGTRLVLTDRREFSGYGQGSFGDTFDRELAAWVVRNFDRVASLRSDGDRGHTIDVWWRKGSS
jgi:hypothetical protein